MFREERKVRFHMRQCANEEVEIRYVIPTSPTSEHLRYCHLRLDYFDMPACANGLNHLLQRGPWWGKDEVIGFLSRVGETATHDGKCNRTGSAFHEDADAHCASSTYGCLWQLSGESWSSYSA